MSVLIQSWLASTWLQATRNLMIACRYSLWCPVVYFGYIHLCYHSNILYDLQCILKQNESHVMVRRVFGKKSSHSWHLIITIQLLYNNYRSMQSLNLYYFKATLLTLCDNFCLIFVFRMICPSVKSFMRLQTRPRKNYSKCRETV